MSVDKTVLGQTTGEPWMVHKTLANGILADIQRHKNDFMARLTPEVAQEFMQVADEKAFWEAGGFLKMFRPYNVSAEGVLTIVIEGVLIGGGFMGGLNVPGLFCGFDYIKQALKRGYDDGAVKGIELLMNSPGGSVLGTFETGDFMNKNKGRKPIQTFVEGGAYSAAYCIAAATDKINLSVSSGTGSVGVYTMHEDRSGMLEKAGIVITMISAGELKVDGNPYEKLSERALGRIQARIDKKYTAFVLRVADYRGIDEGQVRKTEADVFSADESIEVGFADAVGDLDDLRAEFINGLTEKDEPMSVKKNDTPQADNNDTTDMISVADSDAKIAAAVATAKAEGESAVAATRARFNTVLTSDAYKGNEEQAMEMLTSDAFASVDAAGIVAILNKAPKVDASKQFLKDMDEGGGADAGANTGEETGDAATAHKTQVEALVNSDDT